MGKRYATTRKARRPKNRAITLCMECVRAGHGLGSLYRAFHCYPFATDCRTTNLHGVN